MIEDNWLCSYACIKIVLNFLPTTIGLPFQYLGELHHGDENYLIHCQYL